MYNHKISNSLVNYPKLLNKDNIKDKSCEITSLGTVWVHGTFAS